MIHSRATIDVSDTEYALVPFTHGELELLVELWASSDERSTDDLSIQLKARGALALLEDAQAELERAQGGDAAA